MRPHGHDIVDRMDTALETHREGMRALWVSLAVLGATALAQGLVATLSGSVALLSDTLHNVADALTAVPVGFAFWLGRRPASDRFTYGYGRAEDVAGIVVVLVIAGSAVAAAYESAARFAHPATMTNLPAVAAAAVIGLAGNEIAARLRVRTGRRIGSAALVADGLHARADGITSLLVLLSVGGAAAGWRWVDPAVGLLITAAIAGVCYGAARQILARLLDAVDPALVTRARAVLAPVPRVTGVDRVRLRWVGHSLRAEVDLAVEPALPLVEAHRIAHAAEQRLTRAIPRLTQATIHAHPAGVAAHHLTGTATAPARSPQR